MLTKTILPHPMDCTSALVLFVRKKYSKSNISLATHNTGTSALEIKGAANTATRSNV